MHVCALCHFFPPVLHLFYGKMNLIWGEGKQSTFLLNTISSGFSKENNVSRYLLF